MLSVTADGWAFLRLLRPDVGIHCLTIFLCDWAYTGEFSATLATIVTLKSTILHFIAKVLTQVKVSVWHILALGLTWLFSLFSNLWRICSVCGWISAALNVDVLVHRTFSYTGDMLQDMFVLTLSLKALGELYWETGIQTFLCHKPDWIDVMPRKVLCNPHFLIIFILIYLVKSEAEYKICCLIVDLKLLYTKSSKGQKFNAECTFRTMFYEHREVFFYKSRGVW